MVENGQQLLVTGSVMHIARIDETTSPATVGAARDVGTITVVNPAVAADKIELFDSRGGRRAKISERTLAINETAEVLCSNMTLENLAFTFGGDAVQAYTQSSTPLTGVNHNVFPDSILHLHDNSGNYLYNITAVASIGTLVAGTDYTTTPELLKMGCVKIAAGVTAGVMAVAFTPGAITGQRYFNPQKAGSVKVELWLYWTADDWATLYLRDHVQATISPANPEFKDTDYSQMRFTLAIISNLANTSRPAGRFLNPIGTVPPKTF
jgi:hypothetical protein